jgi:hypothetical protein
VFLAVAGLSLVDAVFVFDGLLQELESVCHSFFSEDFLRKVLQLPKDDFESPICYFFGGNIWKLAVSEQYIEFFYG